MNEKVTYHHGDLRNALLLAADELLQNRGLQGFTLRACARLAGVSHTAPKHHFGDVAGLLSAVAERGFARLVDNLRRHLRTAGEDLDAQMYATSLAYVEFAQRYPEHFRIMFRSDLIVFDMQAPPQSVMDAFTVLTNVILRQRGEAEVDVSAMGAPKAPDVANDILLGWCYIHGYAHLRLEGQLNIFPEEAHFEQLKLGAHRLAQLIRSQVKLQ